VSQSGDPLDPPSPPRTPDPELGLDRAEVGVAIVSWNVAPLLRRCLRSLLDGSQDVHLRIVVVDNASTDDTMEILRAEFPQVEVVANDTNLGFTAANNQAFRALGLGSTEGSAPPYIWLLNPDTEAQPGAVGELVAYLDRRPGAGAVGPMLRYGDGRLQSSRRRFPTLATGILESTPLAWHWPNNPVARRFHMADIDPGVAGPVDWVTGAAVLLRTEALEQVGTFDEGFFMYSEELDLLRRMGAMGWQTHYDPAAAVTHHEGRSSEQVVAARHLHFQRSRVCYFRKHHGRAAAAVVRGGILLGYLLESGIESAKWLLGSQRQLRRERIRAYGRILRDGLG